MNRYLINTVDTIIKEADRLLSDYGLAMESETVNLIKSASGIIWNNVDLDIEENLVHWITDIELAFIERIIELHKERILKQLYE